MKKLLLIITTILTAWSGWSQNSITQGANKDYTIQMNVGESVDATYLWSVAPANGTSTDLSVITGNTATILWDGPVGIYSVTVQVTDGNGCLSEGISRDMEILAPGDLIFAAALPNTQTCSDLTGGNGASESLFRIRYNGDANLTSAIITVKNPAGDFVELDGTLVADQNNPEITVNNNAGDKEIDVAVTDNWENSNSTDVQYEIMLISALTEDSSVVTANPAEAERTITVLSKPVIAFE